MCYLTTTTYSCSHTPLANPIQCSDRKGTRKYCQDISFFATDEAALCPRCCTRQESNGLDVSDIDERTEQVITSIKEDMEMLSPLTSDQEELLAELRRCVELYSHKLKKMEGEIAELADSASIPVRKSSLRSSQLSVRESRDDASTQDGENNQIKNLIAQVGAANRFWAGYVKHYENQLERAARTHASWLVANLQFKLTVAHAGWEEEIKKILTRAVERVAEADRVTAV